MADLHNQSQSELQGEHIHADHLQQIRDTYLPTTFETIEPLIPTDDKYGLVFESQRTDLDPATGKPYEVDIQLEEHINEHGKRSKRIVVAAATAGLAGIGIAVLMRGRFSPKEK